MRGILLTLLLTLTISLCYSQSRMVINNDGFVVIDNGAYLVLENSNPNAITTLGTGGNIVSEDEADVIQWEIGTTTGTYVIPWTTSSNVKIPLTINKTTAGTGGSSEFILSTWETATDANTPIPTAVNTMNFNGLDKSLFVVDRFWHIDALSYAAKPDVTLTISYDPSANEIGGTNTIVEANLLAQRFNTSVNHWESYLLFGTNDAGNDRVTNIVVPSSAFFEDWILVDNLNPLPVELVNFEAECKTEEVLIKWSSQTEINNDYYVVEKSYDAINFFELSRVQGSGNSNVLKNYSVIDTDVSNGTIYYRIKQVDFNEGVNYHKIISTRCNSDGFSVDQLSLNNNEMKFNISATAGENLSIYFYDYRGRIIKEQVEQIEKGNNVIRLSNLNLSTGIYLLSIIGEEHSYSTKLMNRKK